jgi:hypothetical protein
MLSMKLEGVVICVSIMDVCFNLFRSVFHSDLGSLRHVHMGSAADVSEMHACWSPSSESK